MAKAWVLLPASVLGHGAMVYPQPRSSSGQVLDDANRCTCGVNGQSCYSSAGWPASVYCGTGCIGESCLYYHIGCFQGCRACSYMNTDFGHLYPTNASIEAAGCSVPLPSPTLGGGDPVEERRLRTYNIDGASAFGDWTRVHPWRSPGSVGRDNNDFSPCGVNSGAKPSTLLPMARAQPQFAKGTDLPPLPESSRSFWRAGGTAEAAWAIYANHGGGYAYRLCRNVGKREMSEACYQQTHLEFATETTEVRYMDGSRPSVWINATTTSKGTWPLGSQWRKNPVPMCGCDAGIGCKPRSSSTITSSSSTITSSSSTITSSSSLSSSSAAPPSRGSDGCSAANPYACYDRAYPKSYLAAGQRVPECPTGLMFPSAWAEGAGAGETPHAGAFEFILVDRLRVPVLPPGDYSLSWRWDCEQTPQVWNSCADITVTSASGGAAATTDGPGSAAAMRHEPKTPGSDGAAPAPPPRRRARSGYASLAPFDDTVSCTVRLIASNPGVYELAMTGHAAHLGQQNCYFGATSKFISALNTTRDRSGHCSHEADFAGCSNYGNPYSYNCVCACVAEDGPGEGCALNFSATVVARSMPTCECAFPVGRALG